MQGLNTIDSYNGIMLCKRPPPPLGSTSTSKIPLKVMTEFGSNQRRSLASKSKLSNNTSTNNEEALYWKPCGSTRIIPEKAKVTSRLSKNDGALRRHKQWLKDMQTKKEEKIKEREEEIRLKETKKNEFMARQAKRRARARETDSNANNNDDHDDEYENSTICDHESLTNANAGEKRSRPVWSMTEAKANNAKESLEAQEEQELMDFVEDLNFQTFYDDMELKLLMSQVKNRIHVLEKETNADEARLKTVMDSEDAFVRNEKFNFAGNIFENEEPKECPQYVREDDEIQSISDTIRSESNNSVTTIHSRKSLQALVTKAKKKLTGLDTNSLDVIDEYKLSGGERELAIPVTITHKEDDGARLAETKSLNKLPFKNRNPAL